MAHMNEPWRGHARRASIGVVLGALLAASGCGGSTAEAEADEVPSSVAEPSVNAPGVAPVEAVPFLAAPPIGVPGFPAGASTPEGAACDLARAFMEPSRLLLDETCLRLDRNTEYAGFISQMGEQLESMQGQSMEQFGGPKLISKLYRARELSATGPSSYGFAVLNLQAVRFVDVETELWDGSVYVNRTLVAQLATGEWRAMPRPDLAPLLSAGLNAESDSTDLWHAGP